MTSPAGLPPPHTRSHGSRGPLARKAVLTGGGPAGWAREPRDPGASPGAPLHVAIPAQPRRGCGKGGRPSPEPWRGRALRPCRPPGTHGTLQPGLGGACNCCTGRAPQNHPPRCREKRTRATPVRPRGPRPAKPGTSWDRKGPRVTFCRRQDTPPPSRVHAV